MISRLATASILVSACMMCASARGADTDKDSGKRPTYLEQLAAAEREYAKVAGDEGAARRVALQMLAQARSMAGDSEGALDAWASINPQNHPKTVPDAPSAADLEFVASTLNGFSPEPAVDAIVRAAKSRQIVILNEAHHVARHRAFATRLALELRKLGFKYLAIETLTADSNAAGLMQRRYPKFGDEDGWYSNEPVFGDFIRRSLDAGYLLVAYERSRRGLTAPQDPYSQVDSREEAQANNLARVLAQDPKARMFVYVGHGHVNKGIEEIYGKPLAMMAERLRAKTGIDPLCIDQTRFVEPLPGTRNRGLVDALFHSRAEESLVLVSQNAPGEFFTSDRTKTEMTVFHRPTTIVKGRPDWLAMNGYRRPRPIPAKLLPRSGRRLIQAFYAAEPADAVPVDQVLVTAGETVPAFMLPKGKFRFAFEE
jgi:hypothetical protein